MDALVVSHPVVDGLRPVIGSRSIAVRIVSAGLLFVLAAPGCGRERIVQADAESERDRSPAVALEADSGQTADARLVVATVPPGATIRIDGEVRGVSPDTVEGLVPHLAQIDLERAASQRVSGSLSLEPGVQSLTVTLPPAAEPRRALPCVCTVTTLPDFAFVSVDGGPSHEIVPFEARLLPGLRRFHVRTRDGRVDTTYTVMVPDGKVRMTIKLDYRARRVRLQ
jgi:hypothetical protein